MIPNLKHLRISIIYFFLFLSFSSFAQTTITTNHPNNNGNGSVTFNVENTNNYDIRITGISVHLGTTATNNIQLLYNTSPFIQLSPPWPHGTIGDGQNGWVSAGTNTIFNSNTNNGIVPVLTNLNLIIPANATYQLGLSATTMQYSSLTNGNGSNINTFTADGVNLKTGDGISWGGVAYPSTPANYPRGLIGSITFVPNQILFHNTTTNTDYYTLQSAIDAANPTNPDIIVLLGNAMESNVIINNSVILQANGFNLTFSNGTLTIPNSKSLTWLEDDLNFNVDAQIDNNGTLTNYGTIIYSQSFSNLGTYEGGGTFEGNFINNGILNPGN